MRFAPVLLIAVAAAGCSADPEGEGTPRTPVAVQSAPARVERLGADVEAGGTVRARTTTVLSSRVMSSIVSVAVRPGDRVRAGQVLVRLDARQLAGGQARAEASLAAVLEGAAAAEADADGAAAALELARASHARIARLAERKAATPAELDAAVAALRGAESRLQAATARRGEMARSIEAARAAANSAAIDTSYAAIVAPFDGVVTTRSAEPGTMAVPGAPLLTVEETRGFRLEVSLDAADTANLPVGTTVPVTLDGLPEVEGTIEEVAPSLDPVAHAYTIKIGLPGHAGLRSGLFGRARFRGAAREQLAVPAAALVRRGQLTLVFVVDRGSARMRYVHVGAPAGDRMPVRSGLAPGERVVLNPPEGLADGAPLAPAAGGGSL